jgi:hypothetical protein
MRGRWVTLRTFGERPIRIWESWFQGDGQLDFHVLAERAGPQLSAFRVRLPAPNECIDILRRDSALSEDMLILPDEIHRWPKVLHWLGWAGKVMPVDRWGNFNGIEMPFDTWDESLFGPRPRSFYSQIDNLFLRSAAALEWMIADLAESEFRRSEPLQDTGSRRPKRGRPADTNAKEDRRIADAWDSGQHKTYEDLANILHLSKRDVELAIDRDRKRRKNKTRKPRQ